MKAIPAVASLLLLCLALAAAAAEAEAPATPLKQRPLSPMMQEITDLQAASHQVVTELTARLAEARGEQEIMDLQREIGRVKMQARVDTLRIQVKYAVAEGNEEVAAELEATITRMTASRQSATQVRPAPAQARN